MAIQVSEKRTRSVRASDETRATTSASRFAGVGKRDKGDRVRAVRKAREIVRWGCWILLETGTAVIFHGADVRFRCTITAKYKEKWRRKYVAGGGRDILAPLLNFFLYFRREKCDKFLRIQKPINSLHYFCIVRKGGEYVKFGKRNL